MSPRAVWSKMPIALKVATTFAILVLVAAAAGGIADWSLDNLQGAWDHEISLALANQQVGRLAFAIKSLQEVPTDYMAVGNAEARTEYAEAKARALELLGRLDAGRDHAEEERPWADVREQVERLLRAGERALRLDPAVGNPAAPALMAEMDGAFIAAQQALDEIVGHRSARAAAARKGGIAASRTARWVALGGAGLIALVAIGMGAAMVYGLVTPVRLLQAAAEAVAGGDLTIRVHVRSRDELGRLAAAFNEMLAQTGQALSTMRRATEAVAGSSGQLETIAGQAARAAQEIAEAIGQVASGAAEQSRGVADGARVVGELRQAVEQIARGGEEQARNAQVTSSTAQEMARSIEQVAANADGSAAASVQASEAARSGSRVVEMVVAGMGRVRETVLDSAGRMQELDRSSAQIGAIIQVITDIADQTNLLALNAAIEAARAGEHGKGFAVVAGEVRNLADRSLRSAGEVADLIRGIQEGTQNAAQAMRRGTLEAEEGSRLAGEAGRALREILGTVEQTSQGVQAISVAAQQIATASKQVVGAIDSVAAVVEENTAATEEMAAGADEVTRSMEGVASISQENAAAAQQVSASIEEMTASTSEIASLAQNLAQVAQELRGQAARFRL